MLDKEVTSLISLLDDTDSEVVSVVMDRLCTKGEEAIPLLESAWREAMEETQLLRLEHVIAQIQENSLLQKLREWVENGAPNMLTGVYYITKLFRPNIEFAAIDRQVQRLSQEVWIELNEHLTALEQVRLINRIIYNNNRFTAKRVIENDRLILFSDLLQSKEGSQLSLCLLYVCMAEQLQLPISGINLMHSAMLGFRDTYGAMNGESSMLFYIDPYNGALCGYQQLAQLVKKHAPPQKAPEYYLMPCSKQALAYRYAKFIGVLYKNTNRSALGEKANRAAEVLSKGLPKDQLLEVS